METRTGIDQIRNFVSFNNVTKKPVRKLNVHSQITNEFMQKHTNFWSVEEMEQEFKDTYGVELTNMLLDSEIFNKFLIDNSHFKMWRELLNKASEIHMNSLVRKAIAY
ncbi:MAG: hypothetical protein ABIM99_02935 [Candidatus Dojkabacteria bacterium]